MRLLLTLLPALALAQTPSVPPAAPAKSAAPAKKAAPSAAKPAVAATAPTGAAAPKPAAAAVAGRGAAGRGAIAPKPAVPAVKPLQTDDEKTVYALGQSIGQSLSMFNLTPAEVEIVKRAIGDAAVGKHEVELSEWGPKIDPLARSRAAVVAEKEKASSAAYLAKCAAEPGAVKTESGLVYKELKVGTGPSPAATDTVKVHYRGTLTNGTEFDSSYKRNEPTQFPLNGVIKCWTEGVQRMKVGGKSQLVCPSDLAYGDQGRPSIPGGATLVFEVELIEIVK
ncbi:MAG: FKBP-type peptidyl-prolyl cis-trans isomerase [Candidatus Solibacter sp.]